jgi:Tfp pilus assembly protein PilO
MRRSPARIRRPDPRKQRLIQVILLGLCLLNVPVYILLVRPVIQADEIVTARAQEVQWQLRKRRMVRDRLHRIESQMGESQARFQEFKEQNLFSKERGNSELLKELEAVCAKAGLVKTRGGFQYDRESRFGTRKLTVVLPIQGSYGNIRRLLNALENHPKFIIIDSLNLEDTREGSGVIRMDLQLSTLIGAGP